MCSPMSSRSALLLHVLASPATEYCKLLQGRCLLALDNASQICCLATRWFAQHSLVASCSAHSHCWYELRALRHE